MSEMFDIDPSGKMTEISVADFKNRAMTPDKHRAINAALTKKLSNFGARFSHDILDVHRPLILDKIGESRVAADDEDVEGSACFPVPGDLWHIGIFGSVWLDVEVCNKIFRVSYSDDTFFVDQLIANEGDR